MTPRELSAYWTRNGREMTPQEINEAIRELQSLPLPKEFVGMVHPLQYLWIKWQVHPWLCNQHGESRNMRDQLEAEWRKL